MKKLKRNCLMENRLKLFKKENINPIFLLNLINCISIINFVWLATKKNIKDFHNILLKVNIMFSYLKRN